MTHLDDITLMAYADGELSPDEVRAVERGLKDNPEIEARLQSFRASGELLERVYAPVLDEKVPEALQKTVDQGSAKGRPWGRPNKWMAMAASIAVVVTVGVLTRELMFKQDDTVSAVATPANESVASGVTQSDMSTPGLATPEVYASRSSTAGGYASGTSAQLSYSLSPPQVQSYAAKQMAAPPGQLSASAPAYSGAPDLPRREILSRDREQYLKIDENPVKRVAETPVSTFSIDVDTGSYANLRRFLQSGRLPPADAVRIEEMINYFDYDYPVPESTETPFTVTTDMTPAFWNRDLRLLRIALKGYEVPDHLRPAANLVFLIDVSGSMNDPAKLPLLKASLRLLAAKLSARDRVSIVVYAGQAGVVLEPVSGGDKAAINSALNRLSAGGSTAGGAGLRLAYEMASKGYIEDGINRILLATDGDFNIGVSNVDELKALVAAKRKGGISLSTLGFGTGNYNEVLMEQIADVGDGNYAYIDTLSEGRKVLVGELNSTLMTIARDVKIQVEFNPALVAEYRLVGYENRVLRREDFSNDKVDAGELGAGHTVTALYELVLAGGKGARMEPLRYEKQKTAEGVKSDELAHVRLRYKLPGEDNSRLIEVPLPASLTAKMIEDASDDLRFAGAVAAFGQILRGGTYIGEFAYDDVVGLARGAYGADPHGYRREFANLVEMARDLDGAGR